MSFQIALNQGSFEFLITLLKIPLMVLGIILLYRLNRIFTVGEKSVESVENAVENVEDSTETVNQTVSILRKLPFVKGGKK